MPEKCKAVFKAVTTRWTPDGLLPGTMGLQSEAECANCGLKIQGDYTSPPHPSDAEKTMTISLALADMRKEIANRGYEPHCLLRREYYPVLPD